MRAHTWCSRRDVLIGLGVSSSAAISGCSDQSPSDSSVEPAADLDVSVQWTQAPGPPGGPVTGIQYARADPAQMYAATPTAGVYYSSDGGASWTQGPSHMHHMETIWASPHDPEVALSTRHATTDGGFSWDRFTVRGEDGVKDAWSVAFDPLDPDRLYAGTETGVSVSGDGGSNWTAFPLETDGNSYGARQLAAATDGDSVLLWASDGGRVFRSRDRGRSWDVVEATRELPDQLSMGLVIERLEPERGYLALNGHMVYRIEDDAARPISMDLPSLAFSGTPTLDLSADGSTLYVIARLREDSSWSTPRLLAYDVREATLTQLDPPRVPHSVVAHPESADVVTVGDETGVLTSRDAGASWEDGSDGIIDSYLTAVAVNETRPETVLAGTECSGGLFVSDDRGETWNWKRSGIPGHHDEGIWGEHYVMHLAACGDRAYATTASGLLISDDAGESWSMLQTDFSGEELTHLHGLAVHPTNPDVVYVGTGRLDAGGNPDAFDGTHIWKSTDGGDTWEELSRGFPTDADTVVQHILVNHHDPSIVYVGTNARDYLHGGNPPGEGLGLFRSTNGGQQWHALDTPASDVTAVAVDGGGPEQLYLSSTAGVYRSSDGGESWDAVRSDFSHGLVAHPDHPGLVFASVNVGRNRRVIVTMDGGENWYDGGLTIEPGTSTPSQDADATVPYRRRKVITWLDLDTSRDRLYAATQGAGLWQADVSDVTETV